jgi:hypothetical protein
VLVPIVSVNPQSQAQEAERLAREAREGPPGKTFFSNVGKIKDFLGCFSGAGVRADPAKVQAVMDWPAPRMFTIFVVFWD